MEFKRMDDVEGVIVPYDFESAWDRISTSSMNSETTNEGLKLGMKNSCTTKCENSNLVLT